MSIPQNAVEIIDSEVIATNCYRRIRDLREDADLTQKQMGLILHCSQQAYANYELGQRDIPTAILMELAHFHQTSVDYILGLTDVRESYPESKSRHPECE